MILHAGKFFMNISSTAEFCTNYFFGKILSGIPLECETVWIQIRPDKMSGLIWVQTVCEGYHQMTVPGKALISFLYEFQFCKIN